MADGISQLVSARGDDIIATRRYLHARPETGFQERETASYIANRLRGAGLEVREGIGELGLWRD